MILVNSVLCVLLVYNNVTPGMHLHVLCVTVVKGRNLVMMSTPLI